HELELKAIEGGIGKSSTGKKTKTSTDDPSTTEKTIVRLWKAHDGGCEACNHTGYKGRQGIYEVLENTTDVQKMIVGNSTSEAIQTQAIKDGMVTMQTDGFVKALRGQTSVEEILRV